MTAKQKILLLTYAKFAYMQNLRICKSLPCVQGFRIVIITDLKKYTTLGVLTERIRFVIKIAFSMIKYSLSFPACFVLFEVNNFFST